jgi:alkylation response protein AidB-like acyl-CoA dehydrogenase
VEFGMSEELLMLKDQVRKFCDTELAPKAKDLDETQRFPFDVFKKAGALGYIGSYLPAEYGGAGGDLFSKAIIYEEFVHACFGFNLSVNAADLLFCNNVNKHGNPEQKKKYIPPICRGEVLGCWALTEPGSGSDALSIKSSCVKDGDYFILNGQKTFITNAPEAQYFVMLTREPGSKKLEGGTAFILERGMPGLTTGLKFDKMGGRCSPTGEVFMEDLRVHKDQVLGAPGRAFHQMFASLDVERALTPFSSIGIARAALEVAVKYALERSQFGKPIAEYQLIQEKIARIATGVDIARTFAYKVVWMAQNGMKLTKEAAEIKYYASRMVQHAVHDALQVFGGYGYMKEYPIERYYRDSRMLEIGAGTTEIQKTIIAREMFREAKGK